MPEKIEGRTKLDKIKNETFRDILKIKPILNTIQERQLAWLEPHTKNGR